MVRSAAFKVGDGYVAPRQGSVPLAEPAHVSRASASTTMTATSIRPRFEPTEAAEAGSAVRAGGPQARWAWFGRAVMGLQRAPRRYAAADRMRSRTIAHEAASRPWNAFAAAALPQPYVDRTAPSPSSSTPSPGSAPHRSFAQVVAGIPSLVGMAGPSRPSAPPGAPLAAPGPAPVAPGAAPPAAAAAAASTGPYMGPPGFQGWPAGTPMPQAASAP
nr:uncharacterized protein LOC127329559 [Lolium perenne]